ncbi:hypothetical protein AB0L47_24820 [Streptomyces bobili]
MLDLPVDRWSVSGRSNDSPGAGPVGVLCPVAVRDLERPADPTRRGRLRRPGGVRALHAATRPLVSGQSRPASRTHKAGSGSRPHVDHRRPHDRRPRPRRRRARLFGHRSMSRPQGKARPSKREAGPYRDCGIRRGGCSPPAGPSGPG